jgi:hypothetical protein
VEYILTLCRSFLRQPIISRDARKTSRRSRAFRSSCTFRRELARVCDCTLN